MYMSADASRTNRDVWEDAFVASKIRDDDYATMSGIPLDPVYGMRGEEADENARRVRLQENIGSIQSVESQSRISLAN